MDDVDGGEGGSCGSASHLDSLLARWAPINYPLPWGQDAFWGAGRPPGTPAATMPGPLARKAWNLSLLAFEQANTCGAFAALIHATLSLVGACRTLRDFRVATDCPLPPACVARENAIVDSFLQYSAVWLTGWALMAATETAAAGGGGGDDDGGGKSRTQGRRHYVLGQTLDADLIPTAAAAAAAAAAKQPYLLAGTGGAEEDNSSVAELRGTCVAAAAMLDMLRGVYDPTVQASVYDDEPTWRTAEHTLRAGYPRTQYSQIGANIVLMLRSVFGRERARYCSSGSGSSSSSSSQSDASKAAVRDARMYVGAQNSSRSTASPRGGAATALSSSKTDSLHLLADVCSDESARRIAAAEKEKRSLAGKRARQRRRPGWWSSAAGTSGDDDDDDEADAASVDTDRTYTPTRKHRRPGAAAEGRKRPNKAR